jgi:cobalamin biosynthesis Mg chelatase CobN
MSAAMPTLRNRALPHRFALALALLTLGSASVPQLLASAAAATPASAHTPTEPASARAQNGLDATSNATPSSSGEASAARTGAATTPTTTYVPAGSTPVPSTAPSTAASTPTVTIPATEAAHVTAATPATAAAPAKKGDQPISTGAIVIAVLAALLILACGAWAVARHSAFEPYWLLSLRHAMAEAGFRVSATWAEFTDWLRLGH